MQSFYHKNIWLNIIVDASYKVIELTAREKANVCLCGLMNKKGDTHKDDYRHNLFLEQLVNCAEFLRCLVNDMIHPYFNIRPVKPCRAEFKVMPITQYMQRLVVRRGSGK